MREVRGAGCASLTKAMRWVLHLTEGQKAGLCTLDVGGEGGAGCAGLTRVCQSRRRRVR